MMKFLRKVLVATMADILTNLYTECEIEETKEGHIATFRGHRWMFNCSIGPSEWTKEMAMKAAIMSYCLEERERKLLEGC
jgi:ADP-ribosylglycohydrolase